MSQYTHYPVSGSGGGISIGGAVTGGTANSVLFVGAGNVLAQDNANFNYVAATHLLTLANAPVITAFNTAGIVHNSSSGVLTSSLVSLTADVTGVLPLANGGTNANLTAANGAIPYSSSSAIALLAPGTSGQLLRSGGAGAPTWTTATFPATAGTSGNVLTSNGTNWISSTPGSSMAIGNTVTGGTAGSMLFVDAAGKLGQNNSKLFYDTVGNNYLFGTNDVNTELANAFQYSADGVALDEALTQPPDKFIISGDSAQRLSMFSTGSNNLLFNLAGTSIATPSNPAANQSIGALSGRVFTGTSMTTITSIELVNSVSTYNSGEIVFKTSDSGGSNSEKMRIKSTGTVNIAGFTTAGVVTNNSSGDLATLPGTTTTVLHGNASGTPTFAAVSLTADVSGILPVANGGTNKTSVTTAPAATSWAGWDANSNLSANNLLEGFTSTATAAGTTTLVVGSTYQQVFTGSTTQTMQLPVATTLVNGQSFLVINQSTGAVTIQTSGANTLQILPAGTSCVVTCVNTAGGTGIASWAIGTATNITATSNATLATLSNSTGVAIHGSNTNDSASAGYVGEVITGNQLNISFPTSTQFADGTSVSLTAGDWLLSATLGFDPNGSTTTHIYFGISSTTGNSTTGLTFGINELGITPTATNVEASGSIPVYRVSLASTTTYYLKVSATYSAGTPKYYANLTAHRIR